MSSTYSIWTLFIQRTYLQCSKFSFLFRGKPFVFLPSFASLNNNNFSSEGVLSCSASENKQKSCVHDSFCWFMKTAFLRQFVSHSLKELVICCLLPTWIGGNARLLEWTINSYLQAIKTSTQKLILDLSRKLIIYNEYNSNKLVSSPSRER